MSSAVLDGVTPRARKSDPVTSVDAGRRVNLPGSQDAVLSMMRTGPDWTQAELEFNVSVFSSSRVRSAVSELVEKGLVEPVEGVFRRTPYGRKAQVYRAVTK